MAQSNAVVEAILAATSDAQVQAAMLLGSRMESSWNTQAVGDEGTSFGPFQIHLPAHPGVSSSEAEDPTWAVNYMLPAYQSGVSQVPSSMWSSNPSLAAATAAYHAERPLNMYPSSTIAADWPYVEEALGGTSVATGSSGSNTSNSAGTGTATAQDASVVSSIFGPIETDVTTVLNEAYMGFIMLLGVILLGAGFIFLFKDLVQAAVPIPKAMQDKVDAQARRNVNANTADKRPRASRARTPAKSPSTGKKGGSAPRVGNPTRGTVISPTVTPTKTRPKTVKVITPTQLAASRRKP